MRYSINNIIELILLTQILMGCSFNVKERIKDDQKSNIKSFSDSLWIDFATAMEEKNIEYLLSHSFDTIQCVDCIIDPDKVNNYYNSKLIFQNYLKELMHLESIVNREFSSYYDDSIIHIIYNIKWKLAPEGSCGLLYTFKKKNEKYLFEGMITLP